MFPEEKDGVLEIAGEIGNIPEEEDTSDAPTIAMPVRQYRKEEKDDIDPWFLPF